MTNYMFDSEHQILSRNPVFHLVRLPINIVMSIAGEVDHGFTQGLAGNGAGVDADTAHDRLSFHHRHSLIEFGSLNGGFLSGWPGTDND